MHCRECRELHYIQRRSASRFDHEGGYQKDKAGKEVKYNKEILVKDSRGLSSHTNLRLPASMI